MERAVEEFSLDARERAAYNSLHEEIGLGGDLVADQLGGWPTAIQNGPFAEGGESEIGLVLQVGSDVFAYPDGMFEALYVCALPEDMLAPRFDRATCLFETA